MKPFEYFCVKQLRIEYSTSDFYIVWLGPTNTQPMMSPGVSCLL